MLIRFLLILGIIVYVIYKISSFFFRAGAASQQLRNYEQQQRKSFNGNIHVDPNSGKDKKRGKYKGGDYIDYEEVK